MGALTDFVFSPAVGLSISSSRFARITKMGAGRSLSPKYGALTIFISFDAVRSRHFFNCGFYFLFGNGPSGPTTNTTNFFDERWVG